MWNRVLLIEDKQYSLLALNEEFQIIKSSRTPVMKDKWSFLAGVWAPIPTVGDILLSLILSAHMMSLGIVQSKTAEVHPLGELIISAESSSHDIELKFFPTPPADTRDLDKLLSGAYVPLRAESGYWVLGDAPKVRVLG